MDNSGKEGSLKSVFLIMLLSLIIAWYWPKAPWLSGPIKAVLDPTFGALLRWNLTFGMFVIVGFISFITTLIQKYATDQETIRELKKQQKEINKKAREFRHDPEKMMDIQREAFPITGKLFRLSLRPIMFTGIPFILFFRWFIDIFAAMGSPKFFGFLSWFWFYLIFAMIIGGIFRKILKVA